MWRVGETWTRTLEPFGITVYCRPLIACKVTRLRHETGQNVHEVETGILEWVPGAPKMHVRYILRCGDNRRQDRAQLMIESKSMVTCRKCREAKKREEKRGG